MAVQSIPQGYHALTPYLIVDGAASALEFYGKVFGAVEIMRLPVAGGRIGHAEIKVGDSCFMLADQHPEVGAIAPKAGQGHTVSFLLYVEDVDAVFARAVAAGCSEVKPVQDQFYGDRSGTLVDPFGHQWTLATHIEDVAPDEMKRRMAALSAGQ